MDAEKLSEEMLDHVVVLPADSGGSEEEKTVRQLLQESQKARGADAKFREAAQLAKSAELSMAIQQDLKEGFQDRDEEKLKRAFRNAGLGEDQIKELFSPSQSPSRKPVVSDDDLWNDDEEESDVDPRLAKAYEAIAALSDQVEKLSQKDNQREEESKKDRVERQIFQEVDKDEQLSTLMAEESDDELVEFFRETIKKSVTKASKTHPWGPRAIQEGLKQAKKLLKGYLESSDKGPADDALTGYTGVGPAGRTAAPSTKFSGKEKKVSINDPNFARSLGDRIRRRMGRGR